MLMTPQNHELDCGTPSPHTPPVPAPATLLVVLAGFGFGLSLIAAIGAQNAFVLRQGLLGRHVGLVIATCTVSDVVLIAAGVAGVGALLADAPTLLTVVRVAGAAFLLGYGLRAARRALRPGALTATAADPTTTRRATFGTVLALTWLNPHVYLDTLVLLGSIAGTHGDGRWAFGAGAALASTTWFVALGRGAALLRPVFARPGAWRALDGAVAVVMIALAGTVASGI